MIHISSAFVVVIDAKPRKTVVDDTLAVDETDDVDETLPVKNVTTVDGKNCNCDRQTWHGEILFSDTAVKEKLPVLGKPEKEDKKPEGDEEAITGFFESFFDCLYKAIEKWFPSDDDDSDEDSSLSEESEDDDDDSDEESSLSEESEDDEEEDTEVKPSTKKAPAAPEDEEERKKKK